MKQTLAHIILGQKGGENRIQILQLLKERAYNINQMAEDLNLNYRTVKHHVDVLVENGLVVPSRAGGYGEVYFLTSMMEENWSVFEGLARKLNDITATPKFFRTLLERTSDAAAIIDGAGDVLFWNKSAEKLFGHSNIEIVGSRLPIFPQKGALEMLVKRVLDGERISDLEMSGVHKDGTALDIGVTLDVIENEEGKIEAYSIFAKDIRERMRTARALEHMASFPRLSPNPVLEVDSSGKVVFLNAAATEAINRLAPGTDVADYLPPDMTGILGHLGDDGPKAFLRRIRVGDAIYDLNIHLIPEFKVARIYAIDATQRARFENEIVLANERLSQLLTLSPAVIYSAKHTGDFSITYISENVERLTGHTPGDFLGDPRFWTDRIHPDDAVQVLAAASKAMERELTTKEYRFRCEDGRYIWVHDEFRLVRDKSGAPLELVGFMVDVTERRVAEDTCRIDEERLRLAQSAGMMGTYVWDLVTNEITFSKELEALYGLPPGGLGNKIENCLRMVHPDDLPAVNATADANRSGSSSKAAEFRIVWADGSVHWISAWGATVRGPKGEPRIRVGMHMDITDRKRESERLAASEERNRYLFETIGVGIVFQDAGGLITSANPEAIRLLGLTLDQMQGRTSMDPRWRSVHEDGSEFPGSEHPAMVVLRTGRGIKGVPMGVYNPTMNGYTWISIDAVPMFRLGDAKPCGVFTTFTEIHRPEGRTGTSPRRPPAT